MGLIRSPSDRDDTRASTCGLDLFLVCTTCGLDCVLFILMSGSDTVYPIYCANEGSNYDKSTSILVPKQYENKFKYIEKNKKISIHILWD